MVDIAPRSSHRGTLGFACMKGLAQGEMYDSPDRLTQPLKKVGEGFEPISWDQAFREIGAQVRQERAVSPHRIGMYVGTAAGFSLLHPIFAQGFMEGTGSRNVYSSATQDCANRFASAQAMYGFPFTQPFPDLDHVQYLLVLGTNPVVSKWTFLQVAHPVKRLKSVLKRGGRVVVVDPRYNETAKVAGEYQAIRPGADLWFLLSFLHVMASRGIDSAILSSSHFDGAATVLEAAADWPPEATAAITGIAPNELRQLVEDFCAADGASIITGTGIGMSGHGTLVQWLVEVIIALSGNLDKRGGNLVGEGIFDFAGYAKKKKLFSREIRSRIGGFRELNGGMPGGILADEILTPGTEQITTLFVTGGNPLMTMPGAERLRAAFGQLSCLVVTDIYLNETASLADYVLPATTPLERPDLPFVFPLFLGMQSIPYLAATEAVVTPPENALDESTIYIRLAAASGVGLFGSRLVTFITNGVTKLNQLISRGKAGFPQRWLLNRILRHNGQPSFETLIAHPDGYPWQGARPDSFLGKRVTTDNGRVQLAPVEFLAELQGVVAPETQTDPHRFQLITKRRHNTHNSWTQNVQSLTRGDNEQTNVVYMHPADIESLGLEEGSAVDIASGTGEIRLPVEALATLQPGVVAVPHGWGHQHAQGLSVASRLRGANVNILAADGPDAIEPLSGMARLSAVGVSVSKAAGPIDPASWSGR